jgi:23S rRNA (uridine2552-2'-O)-methyltransferase
MTRWYTEKKKEHYYKEAKKIGYRARSAFKLIQIQKKFSIIDKGDFVIDLGAAPGSWSQISKEIVGDMGSVIGIDLSYIKPIRGITFLQGDLTKKETINKIKLLIKNSKVDVLLSDMAPNISGYYSIDQAKSIYLCEESLKIAEIFLRSGGNFICKSFMGEDFENFHNKIKKLFKKVKIFSPKASRKTSSEVYLISLGFKLY